MNKLAFSGFLLLCLTLGGVITGCRGEKEGYSIRIRLDGCSVNDSVFLARFRGSQIENLHTEKVAPKGNRFSGVDPLKPGMYATGIKGKDIIEFMISDSLDQQFSIFADITKVTATLAFKNSPENSALADFTRYLEDNGNRRKDLQRKLLRFNWQADSVKKFNAAVVQLTTGMKNRTDSLKKEFPGSLLTLNIGLIIYPEIPEPAVNAEGSDREPDIQEMAYRYYTNHFFDGTDFSDPRLVTIPLYEKKLAYYFQQVVQPHPDSIYQRIDKILELAGKNQDVYNFTVRSLYGLYRKSSDPENLRVSALIGENYILSEPDRWNDPAFVEKVRERTEKSKLNPVGQTATDLRLETLSGEKLRLSDVKAALTILYFFNPDCEACGPITGHLSLVYRKYQEQGVKVFAVYLDRQKQKWEKYIASSRLDWLNVYDPDGNERIEERYDIYAIPMIYLLDSEKRVIAKDVPIEKLEDLLISKTGK